MPERRVKARERASAIPKVLAIAALAVVAGTVLAAGAAPRADSANARVTVKRSHTITLVTGRRLRVCRINSLITSVMIGSRPVVGSS